MINLIFIAVFIFSLAIAVASVLISHQFISTYNTAFHKNYFYYLGTFFSFAFYAIWAQLIMWVLLDSMQAEEKVIEMAANFLPVLGIPFLLISWIMLIKMAYSIADRPVSNFTSYIHACLFIFFFLIIWFLYENLDDYNYVLGVQLVYAQIAILIIVDLLYLVFFSSIVTTLIKNQADTHKAIIHRFVLLMLLGMVLRGIAMAFTMSGQWIMPLLILLYFMSNFIPLFYLRYNSDIVFAPVRADNPSNEKIELLFKKYKITKREREIVGQICLGKTNQQIADELFISLQTVKDHTHRIYSKIGVNSRMKLVQLVNG